MPGPFGRERVVFALPLSEHPPWHVGHETVHDAGGDYLADPAGNLVGQPGLWVPRMATARYVEDTRRVAG